MHHLNSKKFLAELNRRCRRNVIELHVLPAKGSHIALIFESPKGKEQFRIVLSGGKEISPGVQRNILKYVEKLASKLALAAVVRKILKALFE